MSLRQFAHVMLLPSGAGRARCSPRSLPSVTIQSSKRFPTTSPSRTQARTLRAEARRYKNQPPTEPARRAQQGGEQDALRPRSGQAGAAKTIRSFEPVILVSREVADGAGDVLRLRQNCVLEFWMIGDERVGGGHPADGRIEITEELI